MCFTRTHHFLNFTEEKENTAVINLTRFNISSTFEAKVLMEDVHQTRGKFRSLGTRNTFSVKVSTFSMNSLNLSFKYK